jgi:hypothetical protein
MGRNAMGSMHRFRTCFLLLLAVSCTACSREAAKVVATEPRDENEPAPLAIAFKPLVRSITPDPADPADPAELSCGVPPGREQAYDPKTGVFHIRFKSRNYARSAFEITKVADRITRPIVFRLTGDVRGGGCLGRDLTFSVDGKDYPLTESASSFGPLDRTLFRVEQKENEVAIEFTPKGQALLKPGAQIWLSVDTGW